MTVKSNKLNDYKKMDEKALVEELKALKSELFKLRLSLAMNGLDNPNKITECILLKAHRYFEYTHPYSYPRTNSFPADSAFVGLPGSVPPQSQIRYCRPSALPHT